jgi:hypothetical protein
MQYVSGFPIQLHIATMYQLASLAHDVVVLHNFHILSILTGRPHLRRVLGNLWGLAGLYLGGLGTVRLAVLNRYGLRLLGVDRLLLPVSKYAPNTMMAMITYKAQNQYALTTNAVNSIHFKGDIAHYSTVTRCVDLGMQGKKSAVHFF